jgi:hypothetical protein
MLIIKFTIGGSKITWFVNDNWVMVISFLVTLVTSIVAKRIYKRITNSKKKIKMTNPKGGAFLDDCIEPDSIYKLVDRPLEISLKQMLNLPPEAGPIVVSVPVLILAYIVSTQPIKQITISGIQIFFEKYQTVAMKAGSGALGALILAFTPFGVIKLTAGLLTCALIINISQRGLNDLDCTNFVSKVPMERVSQGKSIGFLETIPEKTPKVFIKGSEDTELYIPNPNGNDFCSSEYQQVELKTSTMMPGKTKTQTKIHRKCER